MESVTKYLLLNIVVIIFAGVENVAECWPNDQVFSLFCMNKNAV